MNGQADSMEAAVFFLVAMLLIIIAGSLAYAVVWLFDRSARERNDRNRASLYDEWWRG